MTITKLKTKRIAVLMGGISAEREVSLDTGNAVMDALRKKGFNPIALDVGWDIANRLIEERIQVAFIALHGKYGEDGAIQGLLESMGIPYTGSGVLASGLAMDKIRSRWIFERFDLPVPAYRIINDKTDEIPLADFEPAFPLVVKPSCEGSSVGVRIVRDENELAASVDEALRYGGPVLLEQYISGREIQVGVLDDKALGAIEIRPNNPFYDYQAKYTDGFAEHFMPAPLPETKYREALEIGLKAHRVLGCEGGTRVDLLLDEKDEFFLLEVNTLPGMTRLSLLPEIAHWAGVPFDDLCERILLGARLKI